MAQRTCESVRENLVEYLRLELPETEESEILTHLGQCPACDTERHHLERVLGLCRDFGDFEPAAGGFDRLLDRIRAEDGSDVPVAAVAPAAVARPVQRARIVGAMILTGAVAALFLIAAVITNDVHPTAPETRLHVELVSGAVDAGDRHLEKSRPLALEPGSRIANASEQVSHLRLGGIGSVHLDADTVLVVESRRSLRLERGTILLDVDGASAGDPVFVATADGRATITGTRLDLRILDGGPTALTVLEGAVAFAGLSPQAGADVLVGAGEQSRVQKGQRPSDPVLLPPSERWRYHAWTSLGARLDVDDAVLTTDRSTTLHFRMTNRSSAPLSIHANVTPPYYLVHFDQGTSGERNEPWMDMRRFREVVPHAIQNGTLRLEPGESYRFSYETDRLTTPGLYRIEVIYHNGEEGATAEPPLWRGIIRTESTVWVTAADGTTQIVLGPLPRQGDEPARRIRITGLPLETAMALHDATRRGEWATGLAVVAQDDEAQLVSFLEALLPEGTLDLSTDQVTVEPAGR